MTTPIQTAVVTGAGGGLGRALCRRLARRGARLVVADIVEARCDETARLVEQAGGKATPMVVDVTDPVQVARMADEAERVLGRIDLVVNNAGVASGGAVGAAPLEDWQWVMHVNLWGVIHGCHVFAPRLVRQGSGAILNVASLAGIVCAPWMGPYNVSKAAVIAISETLSAEVAADNVRVTVLCPSFFKTNLLETMRSTEPQLRALAEAAFANSTMTADEVAAAALRAVERGQLYCLPMREGRIAWLLKRIMPQRFARLVASRRLQQLAQQRALSPERVPGS